MTRAELLSAHAGKRPTVKHPNQIKGKRLALGLTLEVMAKEVGLSIGFLSQLELGKSIPSLPTAFELAHFFGCKIEDLYPRMAQQPQTEDTQ
jgi:putative transcriptional regulator